jgi:hypothetical protein
VTPLASGEELRKPESAVFESRVTATTTVSPFVLIIGRLPTLESRQPRRRSSGFAVIVDGFA